MREASAPETKVIGENDRGMHDELSYEDGKHAQATARLAQHIALDRPDMASAVNATACWLVSWCSGRSCQGQHCAWAMRTLRREKQRQARRRVQLLGLRTLPFRSRVIDIFDTSPYCWRNRVLRTHQGSSTLETTCWHHQRFGVFCRYSGQQGCNGRHRDCKPPGLRQATSLPGNRGSGSRTKSQRLMSRCARCPRKVNTEHLVAHVFLMRTACQVVIVTHFTSCLAQVQDEPLCVVQNSSHHRAACRTLHL